MIESTFVYVQFSCHITFCGDSVINHHLLVFPLQWFMLCRNIITFLFIVGCVVVRVSWAFTTAVSPLSCHAHQCDYAAQAILNILVHAMAFEYLDLWPPNCLYGTETTLHYSYREGKRSCARIANSEVCVETATTSGIHRLQNVFYVDIQAGASTNYDGPELEAVEAMNISALPPVYRLTQAEFADAAADFLNFYSALNQSTLLTNSTTDNVGLLVCANENLPCWASLNDTFALGNACDFPSPELVLGFSRLCPPQLNFVRVVQQCWWLILDFQVIARLMFTINEGARTLR